ncbi:MAG: PAS domain S-box protein [Hymenobacteraceae bacterium]|nr:PAS domain S-box protein [Hymenobacteraceae bacterium]MDX5480759.1 PAS domain S-box protein [Hymenobacteraceae bacterium]
MKNTFVSLDEITNFLPDTVIMVDEQIQIVAANEQTFTLFGYHPQEIIGQKLNVLLPHRHRAKHDEHFSAYLTQPSVRRMGVNLHLFGLRKDGAEIDIDVALSPVEVAGKKLVIATIRDVTDKKELERMLLRKNEQLETINAELERFGYMIAHDLKSPLVNIHALVHLMTKELPNEKSEKLEEYITAVQNSLESMTSMISGVSAYSSAGTGENKVEEVDLNLIVAEVQKLIKVPEKGSLEVAGQLPVIRGNKVKVLQVFMNLVCNAFKYNDKEAPRVQVKCSVKEGQYLISVSDNGPGVPTALRRRIFRLFDKGSSQRKDAQGIGLAIVKKIIEERGGRVAVGDSTLGGAEFTFTWPSPAITRSAFAAVTARQQSGCPFQAGSLQ